MLAFRIIFQTKINELLQSVCANLSVGKVASALLQSKDCYTDINIPHNSVLLVSDLSLLKLFFPHLLLQHLALLFQFPLYIIKMEMTYIKLKRLANLNNCFTYFNYLFLTSSFIFPGALLHVNLRHEALKNGFLL